jgi:D-arabinose 1-dehydrogenase-like Zn-dependent alcohol dehydrogenase
LAAFGIVPPSPIGFNPIGKFNRNLTTRQSCGHCKTCASGYRQYCSEARGFAFFDTDQGAFGDYRIINSGFAYPIPESIKSIHAGPLMCAGASTYEALDAAGTKPGDRVGVVGIGGLGHMAILFAKAMGCGVTAITRDETKWEDLFPMGADEVRIDRGGKLDLATFPSSIGDEWGPGYDSSPQPMSIDVLLITSNAVRDVEAYFPLLARRATIVLMTIQQDPVSIPYMPFVLPGHKLIASTEASHRNHFEMLRFAARHQIEPWVETFPMTLEGVSQAFEKLQKGRMRYRGVLVREDESQNLKRRRE